MRKIPEVGDEEFIFKHNNFIEAESQDILDIMKRRFDYEEAQG